MIARPNVLYFDTGRGARALLRLETFGGARLSQDGGPPAQQRRRVALFALLASAGDRGVTREKLVGYLWPESTIGNARHSLEQLIYAVRREYGEDILSRGNPLIAHPDQFSADVTEFEQAVLSGDFERGAALYRGSYFDGFFLANAPEFERWATTESQRLDNIAAGLFEQLAATAEARGDLNSRLYWLRRRSALDALSAHGAVLLMRALAESGDATGALQHAATYERFVRQELASDPDASVTELAREIRDAVSTPGAPLSANHPPAATPNETVELASISDRPQRHGTTTRRNVLLAVAGIAIVAAFGKVLTRERQLPASNLVAVMPFRATLNDASFDYLGEGVMDLLAARFTGEGGPAAVDPRVVLSFFRQMNLSDANRYAKFAQATGASEIIEGEIVQTGDSVITVNARLLSSFNRRIIATSSSTGRVDSVGVLVDRLANHLLASRAGEDVPRIATFSHTSPAAVAAFLQGRAEYRRGQVSAAREHFLKALDHDSTFGAAALELSLASGKLFQWNTITVDTVRRTRGIAMGGVGTNDESMQWQRGLQIAIRDSTRLSGRDRILLAALRGGYPQSPISARHILKNWESAAQALPSLPDAHFWLGHVLLFQGPAMGLPDSRQRARASFERALGIDPNFGPALRGLIELSAMEGDTVSLTSLARRYISLDQQSQEASYVRWRVASVRNDIGARKALRQQFGSFDSEILSRIRLIAQLDAVALDDAIAANTILLQRAGTAQERQLALHGTRQLTLNQGRISDANAAAALKREVEPNADLYNGYAIRDALFWSGDRARGAGAARAFEQALAQVPPDASETRRSAYMRFSAGLWRIMNGDTSRVEGDIDRLNSTPLGRDGRAVVLDALLANRVSRHDADRALARLDSIAELGFSGSPHVINLVSAKIHEQRGNIPAALAAITRGKWFFPPENLSTYLREEGRLALAAGDTARAISAWSRFLRLRASPDLSLRVEVAEIQRRLAALGPRAQ